MLTLKGRASEAFSSFVGEVTFAGRPFYARSRAVLVCEELTHAAMGYKGCITSGGRGSWFHPHHIYGVEQPGLLHEGDIVAMDGTGTIEVLWEEGSSQNCLFLTENCNCRCVMCPQPPAQSDPARFLRQAEEVLELIRGRSISDCCITGGEPTLAGKAFFDILRRSAREHPEALISVLTNGRLFSDRAFVRRLAGIPAENVLFCGSLHSELDAVHDAMTGVRGSCAQTQQGIYNLAGYGFFVEIRTVISQYNCRYLAEFAEHLGNYFPFCAHVAFMGLELHGHAETNRDRVEVSPEAYAPCVKDAVLTLVRRGIPVSLYNIPLCLCPAEVRGYARRSISDWKNIYLPRCRSCALREECCGFFSTSSALPETFIKPFTSGGHV